MKKSFKFIKKITTMLIVGIVCTSQMPLNVLADTIDNKETSNAVENTNISNQESIIESDTYSTQIESGESETKTSSNAKGLSDLNLSATISNQQLDLDKAGDAAEVRFSIRNDDATSKLNSGVLTIDLSKTKLDVVAGSFPTKGSGIKSAVYTNANKILKVQLDEGFSGSTEFPFSVTPSTTAKSGDAYQIPATLSGKNQEGAAYVDATATTSSISIIGTNPTYTEATVETYAKWASKNGPSSWNNASAFAGQSLNTYTSTAKGQALHFSNLRIEKVYKNASFYWGSRGSYSRSEFFALAEAKQQGILEEEVPNSKLVFTYGDVTISRLPIYDSVVIPKDAEPGVYETDYKIYNGDVLIYTTTRKITVKKAETIFSFKNKSSVDSIGVGQYFNVIDSLSGNIASPGMTNLVHVLSIPDGVAPVYYNDPTGGIETYEYELNHSGTFIKGTDRFDTLSNPEDITRIRLTYKTRLNFGANPRMLVVKNKDVPVGSSFEIGTESLTYNDHLGDPHDYMAENPEQTYLHKVNVTEQGIGTEEATIEAYDYGYEYGVDTRIPTDVPIYNGSTFAQKIEVGFKQGMLKNPYIFMILPEGTSVKNDASNVGYNSVMKSIYYSTFTSNPDWKNTEEFTSEKLLDGRTIYYYKLNNSDLTSDGVNFATIFAKFKTNFNTTKSGSYEIEYGIGGADSDHYKLDSSTITRGYQEATLSNEVQTILNASVPKYISLKQTISVGGLNSISSAQYVKGSEDANKWIDGNVGSATSIPGTTVDYQYQLTNNGTSTMENFEFIDMLPYPGDTMITSSEARNSDYSILATDSVKVQINGEDAGPMVYYSQSTDPVRFDANGNEYGTVDDWSPTKPSDITKVKAIKVKLSEAFEPGDTITFSYTGQLPGNAPRDNVSIAYNSLAYRGFIDGQAYAKELGLTGVKAAEPLNDGEISGELFSDKNKNGVKDADEIGYNGVVLELFDATDLSKPVATLNTSPSGTVDGQFIFSNLPYKKYKIRVTLPEDGAFVEAGKNKIIVDKDKNYGWLQVDGKDTFELTDVGGVSPVLSNVTGAVYRYTPVSGTIIFKDKNNIVINGDFGQGFKVELLDKNNKTIAETKSSKNGNYNFDNLDISKDGQYKLKFTAPTGKEFVFLNGTGELDIELIQSVGIKNGFSDIWITDTDLPTGSIEFPDTKNGYNPKKIIIKHEDETTKTTIHWSIENSAGQVVYSGTDDTIDQELAYLKNDKKNDDYTLKVTVSDAAKNTIVLEEKFTILVVPPAIHGTEATHLFEIAIDKDWSTTDYLSKFGVTATDVLGKSLTDSNFTVDDHLVDQTKEGDYQVTITAKDEGGNTAQIEVTVQVRHRKVLVDYQLEGVNYDQVEMNYLDLLAEPKKPTKAGYTFVGWFDDAHAGKLWNFAKDKVPAENMTLYARFEINSHEVTFNNEGAETKQKVAYNALITEPTTPTKTGHTFIGWFDAKEGGNEWQFGTAKMPDNDLTLYAQYKANQYTLTFNDQGTLTTEQVTYDTLISKPAVNPTKPGYTFDGWYETTSGEKWNFEKNKVPANDLVLIAKFKADDQILSFNTDGGSKLEDILAPTDSLVNIDSLPQPTKSGYQFIGWFEGSTQISGTITMPVGGKTLTAHWTAEDQVITFDTDGGTGVASITAKTGEQVDLSTQTTTREGYTFAGWFDQNNQEYTGMIKVPAGGLTLKAKWTADQQWIQFDSNGGTAVENLATVTGAEIKTDKLPKPSRAGYEFKGWFDEAGNKVSGTIMVPAGGLKLKAEWLDLITSNIWQLNVENFEMTLSELNQYKADGTLQEEVLKRSKARAFNSQTDEELTPLAFDLTDLSVGTEEGAYQVKVSYTATPQTATTFAEEIEIPNPGVLEKIVTVTVISDPIVEENTDKPEPEQETTDVEESAGLTESKTTTDKKDNLPKTSAKLEWVWEGYLLLFLAALLYVQEKKRTNSLK